MVKVLNLKHVIWVWTLLYVFIVNLQYIASDTLELILNSLRNVQMQFIFFRFGHSCNKLLYFSVHLVYFVQHIFYIVFSFLLTCLIDRYTAGECCLAEETPPVLSATSPPGRLFLLTDRHAGRPGALRLLPQRGHQEELHSVTPGVVSFHHPQSGGREVIASRHCLKVNKSQVRCCRSFLTCPHLS